MINLLISKLQLFFCVGVASVSVISLPTTLALTANKGTKEILEPLNTAYSTIQTQATSSFDGFDKQLTTQYTDFGKQVAENATESPKVASAKLQNISEGTAEWTQKINEHAATENYYAFKFGHLIKALIKHIPNIIKESFIEAFLGGDELHLLSAQKIYNIAANEKFSDFLTAMTEVVTKHDQLLENLSGEDNTGIIQIFKELKNDDKEIQAFLEKAKTNSSKLESSYACATKLMMHILIGKEEMEKISEKITQLQTLLDKVKDVLEGQVFNNSAGGSNQITVETLKQKLTAISGQATNITNPCPNKQ